MEEKWFSHRSIISTQTCPQVMPNSARYFDGNVCGRLCQLTRVADTAFVAGVSNGEGLRASGDFPRSRLADLADWINVCRWIKRREVASVRDTCRQRCYEATELLPLAELRTSNNCMAVELGPRLLRFENLECLYVCP